MRGFCCPNSMHFFNIYIPNLRAQEYVSSDPVQRATWLNVSAFCCEQENGGRIAGAGSWNERQWMQMCGVTKKEATSAFPLVEFNGDDAIVWGYPEETEKKLQAKRAGGKRGGLARAANASSIPLSTALSTALSIPSTEGNERKGKEMEGKQTAEKPLPECEEFVSYLAPFLADLGDPVPLAGWLAEQFVYYSSNVWPKGQYLDWKSFRHSFPQKYRSRHAEIKAKFPPIPKAASKGIKETPMDKLLRENEEMFADGVHPDKWRAANPGKDYIKCKH